MKNWERITKSRLISTLFLLTRGKYCARIIIIEEREVMRNVSNESERGE